MVLNSSEAGWDSLFNTHQHFQVTHHNHWSTPWVVHLSKVEEQHRKWLQKIKEKISERVELEEAKLPSFEAIRFHWLRTCCRVVGSYFRLVRPHSQLSTVLGSGCLVCKAHLSRGVWGHAPPEFFLQITCSEIESGAIETQIVTTRSHCSTVLHGLATRKAVSGILLVSSPYPTQPTADF